MLQISVLNLQRRRDRRTLFEQNNRQTDLEFIWVEAIDGQTLNPNQLLNQGVITRRASHFTLGSLGCALSHRLLWEQCMQTGKTLLICEDDAILRQDFATAFHALSDHLPPIWDLLLLGYNFDSIIDVEIVPGVDLQGQFVIPRLTEYDRHAFVNTTHPSTLLPLNNAFGTSAYAVSPQGAQRLINLCFPLTHQAVGIPALNRVISPAPGIDVIINNYYRNLHAFCSVPPLAITLNQDSETH